MQCRQPSLEGTGEVPLRRLVEEALRMRPSRIIVGEVRQAESLDLLIALNSGLPLTVNAQCGHDIKAVLRGWICADTGRCRRMRLSSLLRRRPFALTTDCSPV
jgi:Type II/IV secretion system protein